MRQDVSRLRYLAEKLQVWLMSDEAGWAGEQTVAFLCIHSCFSLLPLKQVFASGRCIHGRLNRSTSSKLHATKLQTLLERDGTAWFFSMWLIM